MIVDRVKNINLYFKFSERLAKGLEVLKTPGLAEKEDGKYEVDGDNIYYMISRYKTKNVSEAKFETHKKYIDIQAVLKGKEIIGYAHLSELKETVPYKEDIQFFETPADYLELKLSAGMFAVLFPDDWAYAGMQL